MIIILKIRRFIQRRSRIIALSWIAAIFPLILITAVLYSAPSRKSTQERSQHNPGQTINMLCKEGVMCVSGSQDFKTRGPLINFVFRSRTTIENCAMENCQNWSVCVFIFLKNKKQPLLVDHQADAPGPPARLRTADFLIIIL